ncbi:MULTISPECIES: hypothetical protein [unclassified Streptomyces]|uniref:hypothetical protein n=1 Tax=unclassified Streptomyces TaxID=2593676 RepID=UPI000DACF1CA|nr:MULTISPECIES: hypothetical protein [unclassified Streptomyces]PZT77852.1 hypothetical protein DNK56_32495 [Streptomyces sp. AC1-42W]PZT78197.1 hypothetical protein DNK55_00195 [Streptomyces sp. AC1-42T]
MYLSAAAALAAPPGPGPVRLPLRVRGITARRFGPGRRFTRAGQVPWLEHYFADLSEIYGVGLRPGFLDSTTRNSYAEMAAGTVLALGPFDGPVDLLATAHAVEDSDMERSPTGYVCELLPGDPLPVGVSDQGSAAPFTALRLSSAYVRPGGLGRAVLIALDQSSRPYPAPVPPEREVTADCAVGLWLEADEEADTRLAQWTDVPPESVAELLAGALAPDPAPDVLLAGAGVEPARDLPGRPEGPGRLVTTGRGLPCTGVWENLAGLEPAPGGEPLRVTLVEYEPALGLLCLCSVTLYPRAEEAGR